MEGRNKEEKLVTAKCQHNELQLKLDHITLELNAKNQVTTESEVASDIRLSQANEISSLTNQLQGCQKELNTTHQKLAFRESEFTRLGLSCEQLQADSTKHLSEKEQLRQEAGRERDEERARSLANLDEANDRVSSLRTSNDSLKADLKHSQARELELRTARVSDEEKLDGLRATIEAQNREQLELEAQLSNEQEDNRKTKRRFSQEHDEMQRRLEAAEIVMREAEAKNRLENAEHIKKRDFDRQEFEKQLRNLEQKVLDRKAHSQNALAGSYQNVTLRGNRRVVNRDNNSVLNVSESLATEQGISRHLASTRFSRESVRPPSHDDPKGPLFDDEIDYSSQAYKIPERLMGGEHDRLSSRGSSLSVISSDEMTQLEKDVYRMTKTTVASGHGHSSQETGNKIQVARTTKGLDTALNAVFDVQLYDRTRSQANTASLMQPAGNSSRISGARQQLSQEAASDPTSQRDHNQHSPSGMYPSRPDTYFKYIQQGRLSEHDEHGGLIQEESYSEKHNISFSDQPHAKRQRLSAPKYTESSSRIQRQSRSSGERATISSRPAKSPRAETPSSASRSRGSGGSFNHTARKAASTKASHRHWEDSSSASRKVTKYPRTYGMHKSNSVSRSA